MFVNYGLARRVAASIGGGSGDPNKLTIPQYFGCGTASFDPYTHDALNLSAG